MHGIYLMSSNEGKPKGVRDIQPGISMSSVLYLRAFDVTKRIKLPSKKFLSSSTVPRESKIKVGKYNINYIKVGNGSHHILCLPGIFGTIWTDYKCQIEGIDRSKFTLIIWDAPGHGKSRPPEKEFDLDFFERDADYSYQFMKALKIESYSLFGWSAGGTSSMIHAAKYSEVIRKLVVWGTNSLIRPKDLENIKQITNLRNWSKHSLIAMIDTYGKENFAKYMSKWSDLIIEIYAVRNGNICSDLLPNIKCPTLILHGEKDPVVDKENALRLHRNIAGSRLHLYPKGKHNIHIKYAEDFNKTVQEFLLE